MIKAVREVKCTSKSDSLFFIHKWAGVSSQVVQDFRMWIIREKLPVSSQL